MHDLQDILGLEDLIGDDGQLAPPRRRVGRPSAYASRAGFKRTSDAIFADKTAPPSADSWWVGLSREQLREKAAERLELMAHSKFGRMKGNIHEAPLA